MTLHQLNAHYELVENYITAKTILQRLRDAAGLKAQSITGMPHGGGVNDIVGNTAVEIVRAEERIKELADKVAESQKPIEAWIDTINDIYAQSILRLRYIHGKSWGEVAEMVGGGNTEQSVKAVCYRIISRNIIE
ncbi:MAG: hypothetical protein J6J62_01870 [Oscillospiraceae bacterium]|nr:hypothetical protein [Oscillospiraceae bacterium]